MPESHVHLLTAVNLRMATASAEAATIGQAAFADRQRRHLSQTRAQTSEIHAQKMLTKAETARLQAKTARFQAWSVAQSVATAAAASDNIKQAQITTAQAAAKTAHNYQRKKEKQDKLNYASKTTRADGSALLDPNDPQVVRMKERRAAKNEAKKRKRAQTAAQEFQNKEREGVGFDLS